jgi:hypothetical protein
VVRFTYATELPIPDRTGATAEFSHKYPAQTSSAVGSRSWIVAVTKIGAGAATRDSPIKHGCPSAALVRIARSDMDLRNIRPAAPDAFGK